MANENQNLVKEILKTKNYKSLSQEVVERVVNQMSLKYNQKHLSKEVKNKLHQIWGAFYESKPNFDKIYDYILENRESGLPQNLVLEKALLLHSSVSERSDILEEFWSVLIQEFGVRFKIVDYGCGLNALGLLSLNISKELEYLGYDIDQAQSDFLNKVFKIFDIYPQFEANTADIFNQKMETEGVAFFLKLFPTLEQQQKGIARQILENLKYKQVVVSFPTKSLGRRSRNMLDFYSTWFEELILDLGFETKKVVFENELVYISPFAT